MSVCHFGKSGFPHNGSLSLNQIEKLSQKLGEVKTGKRKKRDVGWKAFGIWKAEAIVRDNQKIKDRKGGGNNNPMC